MDASDGRLIEAESVLRRYLTTPGYGGAALIVMLDRLAEAAGLDVVES